MSLFTLPSLNIGKSVSIPGMNPMFGIPGASSMNFGSSKSIQPTTYNSGISYAPLGDWTSPLGLTTNWGQLNQPVSNWYTTPSPYINNISSVNNTIKNLQPVIPTLPNQNYGWPTTTITKAPAATILPVTPINQTAKTVTPISTGKIK